LPTSNANLALDSISVSESMTKNDLNFIF